MVLAAKFVFVCTMIQFKFTFEEPSGRVSNEAAEGVRLAMDHRHVKGRWPRGLLLSERPGSPWASHAPVSGQYHEHGKPGPEHFPEIVTNESHGISSQTEQDMDHLYYVSKIHGPADAAGRGLWVNIEEMDKGKDHGVLSNSHRQALRVNLSFEFPYYGHVLRDITVTSGGFLYTGDVIHNMLTATQYIAPLMASFESSNYPNSTVIYCDNGTAFVVQWDHVYLEDQPHLGSFTFQAALYSGGRITFAYKEIPVDVSEISSVNHPVKVGLSDAFVILHKIQQIPDIRRRTVYEYHRVELLKSKITNSTVVELLPLPTCLQFSGCHSCLTTHIGFNCSWCRHLQRCSSGFDRYRQDWVDSGCLDERKSQGCSETENVTPAVNKTAGAALGAATPVTTAQPPQTPGVWVSTSSAVCSPVTPATPSSAGHDMKIAHLTEDGCKCVTEICPTQKIRAVLATEGRGVSAVGLLGFVLCLLPAAEKGRPAEPSADVWQTGLLAGTLLTLLLMVAAVTATLYLYCHPTSSASIFFIERRPRHWPVVLFGRGSNNPAYADVEGMSPDKEGFVVMEPTESFGLADRRESAFTTDQRDGFIVPDQKERFLVVEHC
ncbi:plexin domain-containing protein 2 [Electrophorus electricus]|uniref:plexin domain-containing protein 2 n=1 Tax=Electrophorus electricus TaxID=8005 RepID=UPI0015D04539|nr:plexin domain-containing protein 2 [Electrophorus electricus]